MSHKGELLHKDQAAETSSPFPPRGPLGFLRRVTESEAGSGGFWVQEWILRPWRVSRFKRKCGPLVLGLLLCNPFQDLSHMRHQLTLVVHSRALLGMTRWIFYEKGRQTQQDRRQAFWILIQAESPWASLQRSPILNFFNLLHHPFLYQWNEMMDLVIC